MTSTTSSTALCLRMRESLCWGARCRGTIARSGGVEKGGWRGGGAGGWCWTSDIDRFEPLHHALVDVGCRASAVDDLDAAGVFRRERQEKLVHPPMVFDGPGF